MIRFILSIARAPRVRRASEFSWLFLCFVTATFVFANTTRAGGGPENVLLVVNANSESSKTIANCYIELRKIPASNVLYIDWKGSLDSDSGVNFRDKILAPIIRTLDDRHLTTQIDYIVYSSDFPWRFGLRAVYPDHTFTDPFDPWASLTGVTYLLPFILGNHPEIVMPTVNWYVPGPTEMNIAQCSQLTNVPSRGFRSRYAWEPDGTKNDDPTKGQRYLLSTMLGVTQGRGNTVPEVLSYLRRSAAADGTRPKGTIYFMWNKDIRSSTRDKCFSSVAAQINALGVPAKVEQGLVPDGAKDVAGMMVGTADFSLAKSKITILPGAICEHFTSAGGILFKGDFQTPLSEFLRFGAAGASGTISEPHAIQAKFPLASLQLHYARGCSLAEAFYQSITGPYQILIMGDPLCQPWATIPRILVEGIKRDDKVKGTIAITPSSPGQSSRPIAAFEIFIDGRLVARNTPGNTLQIDTTKLPDGYHELRIVGSVADAIETQGRLILPFHTQNHDADLELKVTPRLAKIDGKFHVTVRQTGAKSVTIRQNSRDLGSVQSETGEVEISAATLGRGAATLQAFSEGTVQA
ncbi:MAG TPA: TIGR03790 family protein, partial [Lacipirellulaceae bacterium]|nr:TIGR03790 family protein [Lacipirellulaceae bacterium]